MAGDRRRGGHRRRHQVRSATLALATLEVPVRGRGAAFAGLQDVGIHPEAHRAARATPVEAGIDEDPVETLVLRLQLHRDRTGNDQRPEPFGHLATVDDRRGDAKVLDPRVRARADEDRVRPDVPDPGAGLERHVGERAARGLALGIVIERVRLGDRVVDRDRLGRVRSPRDVRPERRGVDRDLGVEGRPEVGGQGAPVVERALPVGAGGRVRPSLEVRERRVVGRDHPRPGAGLDRHVADRHASFHRQRADRGPSVLEDVPDAAARADAVDDPEDHVLRAAPCREVAVDGDRHRLGRLLRERLGREHVLDLAGADPERERAERAVSRGVRVAADDREPRLRVAHLRTDDVDDALARRPPGIDRDAELLRVLREGIHLPGTRRVGHGTVGRGDVVVHRRDREVGATHAAAGEPEGFERLRAGHLMDEMEIDVEEIRLAGRSMHDVALPDLLGQASCGIVSLSVLRAVPDSGTQFRILERHGSRTATTSSVSGRPQLRLDDRRSYPAGSR